MQNIVSLLLKIVLDKGYSLLNQICKKLRKGKEPFIISKELEEEYEVIKNICRIAEGLAPDYDCDLLFQKLHM